MFISSSNYFKGRLLSSGKELQKLEIEPIKQVDRSHHDTHPNIKADPLYMWFPIVSFLSSTVKKRWIVLDDERFLTNRVCLFKRVVTEVLWTSYLWISITLLPYWSKRRLVRMKSLHSLPSCRCFGFGRYRGFHSPHSGRWLNPDGWRNYANITFSWEVMLRKYILNNNSAIRHVMGVGTIICRI